MQSIFQRLVLAPLGAAVVLPLVLLASVGMAQAQQVYRIVGPDGKVTFSDRPPAETKGGPGASTVTSNTGANPALPYELKQVVSKFPVTLYTMADCGPCANAKALLNQRGIPYTEKTVSTNEDQRALQAVSGDTQLPFGTIGGQQIKGFSSQEWSQYLDAANYPAQSKLPRGYRNPEPTPLVSVVRQPAAAPSAASQSGAPRDNRPAPVTPPATDGQSNPAGIRF